MTQAPVFFSPAPDAPKLAYLSRPARPDGEGPGLFWLGGFRSDMRGTKAEFLDAYAERRGRALLRFDYSGHGESEGDFSDGAIGVWAREALAIFRALTKGPQIVVGSSMGGWIALLLARELARLGETDRLAGMALIAPAVDFTSELIWPQLPEFAREAILAEGFWMTPQNAYGASYPMTKKLFEDGAAQNLFGAEIRSFCPVAILQGMADPDVPWVHAQKVFENMAADRATISFVKDGDHRLSRPEDLALLGATIDFLAAGDKNP